MYDASGALIAMFPPPPAASETTSNAEIMISDDVLNTPEPSLASAAENHYSAISLASDEDNTTSDDEATTTGCGETSVQPSSRATSSAGNQSPSASISTFTSVTPLPLDLTLVSPKAKLLRRPPGDGQSLRNQWMHGETKRLAYCGFFLTISGSKDT